MTVQMSKPEKSSNITAGAAGASGGTMLVALAEILLPEGNPVKPVAVWMAPSVSVCLSGVWIWVRDRINAHLVQKRLEKLMNETRETIDAEIDDPRASQEQRNFLQEVREALIRRNIKRLINQIEVLMPDSDTSTSSDSPTQTDTDSH